jgi:TolB-like protein
MKFGKTLVTLSMAAMIISGCTGAAKNQTHIADEPLVVQQSRTTAGSFNSQMIFMADQIERNLDRKSPQDAFIVTSFSNLHNLSETSALGRLISENLIHELQVRKWRIFEVRLTKDVIINETGEFSLSRDIMKIKELYKVAGIVVGTYSITGGHVFVNARVIDINSGIVVSSAQIHMPVNWFTESLLPDEVSQKPMKIVGGNQYSYRDNPVIINGDISKPVKKESSVH